MAINQERSRMHSGTCERSYYRQRMDRSRTEIRRKNGYGVQCRENVGIGAADLTFERYVT